ncbi:MAG: hypothetical protein WC728_04550 [Elusimicrobiota bacterium]
MNALLLLFAVSGFCADEWASTVQAWGKSLDIPEGVKLRVGDTGGSLAQNEGDTITFNREELAGLRDELLSQGVSEKDLPRLLALKTLPVIAHELRHARTQSEVAEATGRSFEFPLIEDEVMSFAEELKVLRQTLQAEPRLAELRTRLDETTYKDLQAAAAGGMAGLDAFVRQKYPRIPSVRTSSSEDLSSGYSRLGRDFGGRLGWIRELQGQHDSSQFPAERADIQAALARMGPAHDAARLQRSAQEAAEFMADPERAARFKGYYRSRLPSLSWR